MDLICKLECAVILYMLSTGMGKNLFCKILNLSQLMPRTVFKAEKIKAFFLRNERFLLIF